MRKGSKGGFKGRKEVSIPVVYPFGTTTNAACAKTGGIPKRRQKKKVRRGGGRSSWE